MLFIYWFYLIVGQTLAQSLQTDKDQGGNDDDITYIMDTNQFYNFTNRPDAYTIVKFYTTWCSHCKILKPVFQEVAGNFHDENLAGVSKINFIEVNCDVFGNNLCSSLPGFPIIHVIKPSDNTIESHEDEENKKVTSQEESLWNKLLNKVWATKVNRNTFIEPTRVVQFEGRRDAPTIENFIRTIIAKDNEVAIIKTVLNPTITCDSMDELCQLGKKYLEELQANNILKRGTQGYELVGSNNSIDAERSKLNNIQRNIDLGGAGACLLYTSPSPRDA